MQGPGFEPQSPQQKKLHPNDYVKLILPSKSDLKLKWFRFGNIVKVR